MRGSSWWWIAAVLVSSVAFAQVPGRIPVSARLQNDGVPLTGAQSLTFRLFDTTTGTSELWTESQSVSFAADGLASFELGAITPITLSVLDGRALFLEVEHRGQTLSPRLAIGSVPYARRAEAAFDSARVGGIAATDVQRRVTGTCPAGQAVRAVDAMGLVTCESVPAAPTASAPLQLSGGSLALAPCPASQSYRMNDGGTAWECAAAAPVTPSVVAPLTVTGGAVAIAPCTAGNILKMNAGGTAWTCVPETTYSWGVGFVLTGTAISLNTNILTIKDGSAGNQVFGNNILAVDFVNNRVGVGTSTPGAPLEVSGEARASSFKLAAPDSYYRMIPATAFTVERGGGLDDWYSGGTYGYIGAGGSAPHQVNLVAALSIPEGATITNLFCHYADSDAVNDMLFTAAIQVRSVNSPSATNAINLTLASTGSSSAIQSIGANTASPPVVSNSSNVYSLQVSIAAAVFGSSLRLFDCGYAFRTDRLNP